MDHLLANIFAGLEPGFKSGASAVPVFIAVLIALAVLVGVTFQVSLWWRYRRGDGLLRVVRDHLTGDISFENVRASLREVIGPSPQGAGAFLRDYVERAALRGPEFQPASMLESVGERERQLWRFAFVRWVTGTALVMGLSGTFVAFTQLITGSGLLEALGTLHNTPSSEGTSTALVNSYAQLSTAFTRVYTGFGYAFMASLAGLVGTMALGFMNTIFVNRARAYCLSRMEDFGEEVLRPLLTPTGRQTEDLTVALGKTAGVLGTFSQAMEGLRGTSDVLERAAKHFDKSQGANSEMITTLTRLASEIETSRQRWDVLLDALRESRVTMGRTVDEFKKEAAAQRELTNASTAETLMGMRSVVTGMSAEIQQISAAKADHFVAVQSEVHQMLVESKKDWDRVSVALIGKTDEAFKLALATVQGVIADGRNDADAARHEISDLTRETASVVVSHQQALTAHAAAVTDSLREWSTAPAQVAVALETGRETLDRLTATLETLNAMPDRWEKRVLGSIKELNVKLDESSARVERGPGGDLWAKIGAWLGRQGPQR